MSFDRFDVCAAYNLYAVLYGHDDYTRGIQARLARISYKPSLSEEYLCGLSANAREIFTALVETRHTTGYVHCACCSVDTIGVSGVAMCHYCTEAGCEPQCASGCPACAREAEV